MKIIWIFSSLLSIAASVFVQRQKDEGGISIGDFNLDSGTSTKTTVEKRSGNHEDYRKDIIGRWYMKPRVGSQSTVRGSVVFLKNGTIIMDMDVSSKTGSQDMVGRGKYFIEDGVIYSEITDIHPPELKRMSSVKFLMNTYNNRIHSLSKNELILGGKGRDLLRMYK